MYPSVKQLLKVKDDIFDAIRKSVSTDALSENYGNTSSTKSSQQIKPTTLRRRDSEAAELSDYSS